MSGKDNCIMEQIYNYPLQYKQCKDCNKLKPTSDYYKDARGNNSYHTCCKECEYKALVKRRYIKKVINSWTFISTIPYGFKKCCKCNKLKIKSEFYKHKQSSDGVSSQCKMCLDGTIKIKRKIVNSWTRIPTIKEGHKLCIKCNVVKPLNEFANEDIRGDRKYPYCKECVKQWQNKNRDKINKQNRIHASLNREELNRKKREYSKTPKGRQIKKNANHRRRIKEEIAKKYNPLEPEEWDKIIDSQGNKCAICGKPFNNKRKPQQDHIVPLSKGGTHASWNIQALCVTCNSKKGAKENPEYIQSWIDIDHGASFRHK